MVTACQLACLVPPWCAGRWPAQLPARGCRATHRPSAAALVTARQSRAWCHAGAQAVGLHTFQLAAAVRRTGRPLIQGNPPKFSASTGQLAIRGVLRTWCLRRKALAAGTRAATCRTSMSQASRRSSLSVTMTASLPNSLAPTAPFSVAPRPRVNAPGPRTASSPTWRSISGRVVDPAVCGILEQHSSSRKSCFAATAASMSSKHGSVLAA
jgi:hypothetical protein